MRTRPLAITALAALALFATACSDDSKNTVDASSTTSAPSVSQTTAGASTAATGPSTGGDLEAFCSAGAEIDTATSAIDGPEAAVTVFTDLRPTIDDMVASAPDDVADDAQAFADHVDDAVASRDFTAFEDGTVDALVAELDAACSELGQ